MYKRDSFTDNLQLNGYLYKKSSSGEWQKRYFETNGNYLTYYKTQKMTKLLAALSIPQVGAIKLVEEITDDKGYGYIFQIDLKDRQYLLRASSREEAEKWVDGLIVIRDGRSTRTSNPLMVSTDSASRGSRSTRNTEESNYLSPSPQASFSKASKTYFCCFKSH